MVAVNQSIVYLSQLNLEEMIREYGEEETVILMNKMEKKILELQKMLVMFKEKQENQRKRQEDRE